MLHWIGFLDENKVPCPKALTLLRPEESFGVIVVLFKNGEDSALAAHVRKEKNTRQWEALARQHLDRSHLLSV